MLAISRTSGFSVSDSGGERIGRVECPLFGTEYSVPDAMAVRSDGRLARRRFVVPATAIRSVDERTGEIELNLERGELVRF